MKPKLHRVLCPWTSLLVIALFSRTAWATRMPGAGDYAVLLLVVAVPSVMALVLFVFQVVFTVLLLRRLNPTSAGSGTWVVVVSLITSPISIALGAGTWAYLGLANLHQWSRWVQPIASAFVGLGLALATTVALVLVRQKWASANATRVRLGIALLAFILPLTNVAALVGAKAFALGRDWKNGRLAHRALTGAPANVRDVLFTADGKRLLVVRSSGYKDAPWPHVLAVNTGRLISSSSRSKRKSVAQVCHVPGGLVWLENRGTSGPGRLLFRAAGSTTASEMLTGVKVNRISCSHEGKTVVAAAGRYRGTVHVLAFPGGQQTVSFPFVGFMRNLAVSHDGRVLAHDTDKPSARVLVRSASDGHTLKHVILRKTSKVTFLKLGPKGQFLAVGQNQGQGFVVSTAKDAENARPLLDLHGGMPVFLPKTGDLVVFGAKDGEVQRRKKGTWDIMSKAEHVPGLQAHGLPDISVVTVATVHDNPLLLVARGQTLRAYHLDSWKPERSIALAAPAPEGMSVSPDGRFLVVAGPNQALTTYSLQTGQMVGKLRKEQVRGKAALVTRSPTTGRVAVVLEGGRIAVLQPDGLTPLHVSVPHPPTTRSFISSAAFSRDGRQLLVGDVHGLLRLWQVSPDGMWTNADTVQLSDRAEVFVAPAEAGGFAVTQANGKGVSTWTCSGNKLHSSASFKTKCDHPSALASSAAAGLLAEGCTNGTISLLNAAPLGLKASVQVDSGSAVTTLAFSPDGTLLISGHRDASVFRHRLPSLAKPSLVWASPRAGASKYTKLFHATKSVTFSPDGSMFAIGGTWKKPTVLLFRVQDLP